MAENTLAERLEAAVKNYPQSIMVPLLREAAAALRAPRPQDLGRPVVKALEWEGLNAGEDDDDFWAQSIVGTYNIYRRASDDFALSGSSTWGAENSSFEGVSPTLEAAKAAAQADYESRILSCLTAAPPPPKDGADRGKVASLRASASRGVGVKALNWLRAPMTEFVSNAETPVGIFTVWTHHEAGGVWFSQFKDGVHRVASDHPSEETAKAAAQAGYEARVLVCLDVSAIPAEQDEVGR